MNIAIGGNSKQVYVNQTASNTNSNAMNALMKQKENLQDQIKSLSQNKELSNTEKTQKLSELQKQMDELNTQIGKQKLEDMKNKGEEIAKNLAKKTEESDTKEEKQENASVALTYGLISATADSNHAEKLNKYRKAAIKEEGPNSDRVKRIDSMISDKTESLNKNIAIIGKAIEEYSKNIKNEQKEKIHKKLEENSDSNGANEKISNLDINNNEEMKVDSNDVETENKEKESDEQTLLKNSRKSFINVHA